MEALFAAIEEQTSVKLDLNTRQLIALGVLHLKGKADNKSTTFNEMKKLEATLLSRVSFALEEDTLQITILTPPRQVSQVHIQLNQQDAESSLTWDIKKNIVNLPFIQALIPNVMEEVNFLQKHKKPVFVFLGGVRQIKDPDGLQSMAINLLKQLVAKFSLVGVITAGYKGMQDKLYGSTRAAHEASIHCLEQTRRLVIMPDVKTDHHTNIHAIDLYGKTWGDNAPYLVGAADAVFVYSPYGAITHVEIETALGQNKPVVIINTEQDDKCVMRVEEINGFTYSKPVHSFKSYEDAAQYLLSELNDTQYSKTPLSFADKTAFFSKHLAHQNSFGYYTGKWNEEMGKTDFIAATQTIPLDLPDNTTVVEHIHKKQKTEPERAFTY